MTTETILSVEKVIEIVESTKDQGPLTYARTIEQAVLQSEQVQAWKKDAERYRATRAGLVGTDPDYGSRFCEYCDEMGIKQAENITEEQFDAATDAAMENKS